MDAQNARRGAQRVWALVAAVALVDVAAGAFGVAGQTRLMRLPVPFLAILVGYVITERFPAMHLELRGQSQFFTLSAIPTVFGLFALDPPEFIAARVVAGTLAFGLHRRPAPFKLAANASSFWLEITTAVLVFRALDPGTNLGPRSWIIAIVAVLAGDFVQSAVLSLAISLYAGGFSVRELLPAMAGTAATAADACLALAGLSLLHDEPASLALLAVVPLILWASYGAQTRLFERKRDLESLLEFARVVNGAVLGGTTVEAVLAQTRLLLRADIAWLFVTDGAGALSSSLGPGSGAIQVRRLRPADEHFRLHQVAVRDGAVLIDRSPDAAAGEALSHEQVLVAPVVTTSGATASLGVADRAGTTWRFGQPDRRLLETLAWHTGLALANDHLIDRLREESASSEYRALHDPLTGLANRTMFEDELTKALANGGVASVMLLDLDRFKEVNDTLGHANGDRLLCEIARRLTSTLRSCDMVARLGGDEFAIVLPGLTPTGAVQHAARTVASVLEEDVTIGDLQVAVAVSIGIASAPRDGEDAATLLQRADVAMYLAKSDQGGPVTYDAARDEYRPERLAMVSELHGAILAGEIEVHYQPQLELRSGRVLGVEALARWHHPVRGWVPPAEFVPVAETTGLIGRLTQHVLTEALTQAAAWRTAGRELRMSVNLSARDVLDQELPARVAEVLRSTGVDGSQVCLEITETSAVTDANRTAMVVERLATMGVTVSIDDFGTGYSSLVHLRLLRVQEVKIDRAFILGLNRDALDAEDQALVRAILDLGRALGLQVVAEGIEGPLAMERLAAMGCEIGQGYHFTRPMPAAGLETWLDEHAITAPDDDAPATARVIPIDRRH